ncbi:MAG: sigma-70 family RNA polymerase sigma factor [Deltaproteobacteria bacterium]|nr:sigma-70 family RNA polymerase sigma factor [Deltaproteobacteria bacterium]
MGEVSTGNITGLLERWSEGDGGALEELTPLVYAELRRMARRQMKREGPGHTLQTTALVHETYLRLVEQKRANWACRGQFYAVAATLMRRVLYHHVERRKCVKRGEGWVRVPLTEGSAWSEGELDRLLDLTQALEVLEQRDPRQARIVELHFFVGCALEEVARQLSLSLSTVKRDWRLARAWLSFRLRSQSGSGRQTVMP